MLDYFALACEIARSQAAAAMLKAENERLKELLAEVPACVQCSGPHLDPMAEYCPACIEARWGSFHREPKKNKENAMPDLDLNHAVRRAERALADYQRRTGSLGEGWPEDVVAVALIADLMEWSIARGLPFMDLLSRAEELRMP